jgi:mannose-6-phosphate isomerase-like protein (cupin superfamily)
MPSNNATVIQPGGGTDYWILGDQVTAKLGPQHTGGTFSVAEITAPPGGGPPPHVHSREDEMFFVLEGTFSFFLKDQSYQGGPGACVYLPKGVPHTFKNVGETPGKFLAFAAPTGFEKFAAAVASKTRPTSSEIDPTDVQRLLSLAPEFGIDMNPMLGGPPRDAGACPDGKCLWVLGELVNIKLTSADSGGKFSVVEVKSSPGGMGPPPHRHREQDEMFYVLEGAYEFLLGNDRQTVGAGALLYVPRGVVHTFRNAIDGISRLFDLHTPGGFEAFFEECGVPAKDRESRPPISTPPADVLALFDRHGMEYVAANGIGGHCA